jgi:hypothetical protein
MSEITYAYFGGLEKSRDDKGYLNVKGLATDDTLDLDEQICDPQWLKTAMPKWFEIGNIREQHDGSKAVGKATSMTSQGTGFAIGAKIVDPVAAMKVEEGVYTGFSIGIKGAYVDMNDPRAPRGVIKGGQIVEVSVVDRPANPSASFELAKTVGDVMTKSVEMQDNSEEVNNAPDLATGEFYLPCSGCNGTGEVHTGADEGASTHPCEACGGTGKGSSMDSEDIQTPTATSNEALAAEEENDPLKSTDAEVEKREFTEAEREAASESGAAMPDGSFPIKTVKDLKNAIQAFGRAKDPAKAKAHIKARAKALGKENLIPDNWKGADADLVKADDMEHDPAELIAVRAGLIALIKAELDEMLAGEENEICDVTELLCSLSMFLDWWTGEASENETEAPFTGWDMDESGDDMAYIGLGVSADLVKAVGASDATDEIKSEFKTEVLKALGMSDELTAIKTAHSEAIEQIELLKAEMDIVKNFAAPSDISLIRPDKRGEVITKAAKLRMEIKQAREQARTVTADAALRELYNQKADELQAQLAAMENN